LSGICLRDHGLCGYILDQQIQDHIDNSSSKDFGSSALQNIGTCVILLGSIGEDTGVIGTSFIISGCPVSRDNGIE
jgi:hypothetical protein